MRKDGFHVGRYFVSPGLGAGRKGKREVNATQEVSGSWLAENMLQDRTVDDSLFTRLAPGATYTTRLDFHVDTFDEGKLGGLQPGKYFVEILLLPWVDTNSTKFRIEKELKMDGPLWTKSVLSDRIPFTISDQKIIKVCDAP